MQRVPPLILKATSLSLCPVTRSQGLDRPWLRPGLGPHSQWYRNGRRKGSWGWGSVFRAGSYLTDRHLSRCVSSKSWSTQHSRKALVPEGPAWKAGNIGVI